MTTHHPSNRQPSCTKLALLAALAAAGLCGQAAQADSVVAWGDNFCGALGNGTIGFPSVTPLPVTGLSAGVTAYTAGDASSFAIQGGSLYAWGDNVGGVLGDGTTTNRSTPVPVVGLSSGVTLVESGWQHTLALQNGALYSWGFNDNGELGDGTTINRPTPVPVIGLSSGVTALAGGGDFSLALVGGGIYAWGTNAAGELGDGTTTTRTTPQPVPALSTGVTKIAAGGDHCLALKDGALYAWGYNHDGELGDGTTTNRTAPVAVAGFSSGVTAFAAGYSNSLVVKNGGVWAWGYNADGELGDGSTTHSLVPELIDPTDLKNIVAVAAGYVSSFALSADGSLWVWGGNYVGELALGNMTAYHTPQHVLPPTGYIFTSIDTDPFGLIVLATLSPEITAFTWTGAGNGSWGTSATNLNWTSPSATVWSNNANRTMPSPAIFALATPATITVNDHIDVSAITFATGGWVLSSGTGALAYGANGTINITTTTGTDTINAAIANGSTFGSGGGITGLSKSGAGTLILNGPNTYSGDTTVNDGILLVKNLSGSATGSGTVYMQGGTVGGAGSIAGTVQSASNDARWTIHPSETLPATSATTLVVGGLTASLPTNTLDFNLLTPGASSVNDVIKVTKANALTLNRGTMAFTNHSIGAASLGYYRIIRYSGAIQGKGLSSLTMPPIVNNISYILDAIHDPGFVDVHRGLLGDANDDGLVNFADFVQLSNNFGQSNAGWTGGDFNNDGIINFSDFVILSNNFGATITAAELATINAASGVPEPASIALLALAALPLLARRRRPSANK